MNVIGIQKARERRRNPTPVADARIRAAMQITGHALRTRRLNWSATVVLVRILDHCVTHNTDRVVIGLSTLVRESGLSRSTVKGAIRRLIDDRMIEVAGGGWEAPRTIKPNWLLATADVA